VLEIAQGFPKRGAKIVFNDYVFNVESLDKKRLRQIKVTLPQKEV
jgi:Mg2+/Co2+ transporter CorC